ncbi:MAG: hypothetical protein V1835_03630 [Candidatus Micrarchaeota archaeon]
MESKSDIMSFSMSKSESLALSKLQEELQVKSRSKLLRIALEALESESRALKDFRGIISAVLIVSHSQLSDARLFSLRHDFDSLIKMQLHHSLQQGCIELFFIEGSAAEVREMYAAFRSNAKVKNVKIFVF